MRGLRGLMGLMGPMRPMRPMGLRGPMRPMGPMGLRGPIRLMGLIGLIGLLGCSGDSGEQGEEPEATGDAITFSGQQDDEEMVTRADTPLSESGVTSFTVWGYKNNGDAPYGRSQEVFPAYTVEWKKNSEATTTTNSSGWDYILPDKPLQTIKYWDWGASAYRFFAVTNWAGESDIHEDNKAYGKNGTYGDGDAYSMYKITMEIDVTSRRAIEDIPYFSTLWFSTGNLHDYPTREFGKPVQLVFTKPYSKVRFMYNYVYDRKKILLESQVRLCPRQHGPPRNRRLCLLADTEKHGLPPRHSSRNRNCRRRGKFQFLDQQLQKRCIMSSQLGRKRYNSEYRAAGH